ncbi:MAG TPA: tripartite tricarboxylate transporter substrate binding protein [Burkholderiales bacterium]|nr:tripartite tricarboxylate transporter substrate binding protein [Burkholderiales bacterium]
MKQALLQLLFVLAAAGLAPGAGAQADSREPAFPAKPVRLVVPFTAGSSTDIIARILGPRLAERWVKPVVIDNRPGAGGILAGDIVAAAEPDGHTLMVVGSGFAGSAALNSKLPYDSVEDFAGVTQILTTPLVLVVSPALGVSSIKELIALARHESQQINFASAGLGSGTHYGAELFKLAAGINAIHVPYRGSPQALTDTMSGRVHFYMSPILPGVPLIKSGKLLALGVTTRERALPLPDVPTIAEAALPGFEYQGWGGLLAPGKTPREVVYLISREVGRILALPEITMEFAGQGAAVKPSTPEAFEALIRSEIAMRRKVWKAAGVKVE